MTSSSKIYTDAASIKSSVGNNDNRDNKDNNANNSSSSIVKEFDLNAVYNIKGAAVGDLPNDEIKNCKICKDNGFEREPIIRKKVTSGRIKTDGSYEFEKYQVLNYYTDKPHVHKDVFRDLGPILWSKIYGDKTRQKEAHDVK